MRNRWEKKKNALMRKHSIKEEWFCLDDIPCDFCRGRVEVFVARKLYVRFAIVVCIDTGSVILMNNDEMYYIIFKRDSDTISRFDW